MKKASNQLQELSQLQAPWLKLQRDLMLSLEPSCLGLKALLKFGREQLSALRKIKSYMREGRNNEHWELLYTVVISHLQSMPALLTVHLSEMADEDENQHMLVSVYSLAQAIAFALHDEEYCDTEALGVSASMAEALELSQEQLQTLQQLELDF